MASPAVKIATMTRPMTGLRAGCCSRIDAPVPAGRLKKEYVEGTLRCMPRCPEATSPAPGGLPSRGIMPGSRHEPVLVTGATGRVGRRVIDRLIEVGVPVRAL